MIAALGAFTLPSPEYIGSMIIAIMGAIAIGWGLIISKVSNANIIKLKEENQARIDMLLAYDAAYKPTLQGQLDQANIEREILKRQVTEIKTEQERYRKERDAQIIISDDLRGDLSDILLTIMEKKEWIKPETAEKVRIDVAEKMASGEIKVVKP